MNVGGAETASLVLLGDRGDPHYLLLDPKLPDKDNNLISLRSSLPLVVPKLPDKGNNLIQSVKPHTALEASFLLEEIGCRRAISLFTFGK